MKRWRTNNGQKRLWLAALLLAIAAVSQPRLPWLQTVYRYVFVLDITRSMTVRDYHLDAWPAERLAFAQAALRQALHALPCGSEASVALFTTKNALLLFEPLEVCEHYAVIDAALSHADWRMAWAADSYIADGVFASLNDTAQLGEGTALVFLSDGQQSPVLNEPTGPRTHPPGVSGWLVGVGSLQASPVPLLDKDGRQIDWWRWRDVDAHAADPDALYLSRLDENELKHLAGLTGLRYLRLEQPDQLRDALLTPALGRQRWVSSDARGVLAGLALLCVLSLWLPRRTAR